MPLLGDAPDYFESDDSDDIEVYDKKAVKILKTVLNIGS